MVMTMPAIAVMIVAMASCGHGHGCDDCDHGHNGVAMAGDGVAMAGDGCGPKSLIFVLTHQNKADATKKPMPTHTKQCRSTKTMPKHKNNAKAQKQC